MKLFTYKTIVHLRDTDATGVLFFADQFKIALEAFEAFLKVSGSPLRDILEKAHFLMPIVHAEADYFFPLRVGDELEIAVSVTKVGTTSFTCHYAFFDPVRMVAVGKVSHVHVTVSKETGNSIPLPETLKKILDLHFVS